jgi:hypothetical protein
LTDRCDEAPFGYVLEVLGGIEWGELGESAVIRRRNGTGQDGKGLFCVSFLYFEEQFVGRKMGIERRMIRDGKQGNDE